MNFTIKSLYEGGRYVMGKQKKELTILYRGELGETLNLRGSLNNEFFKEWICGENVIGMFEEAYNTNLWTLNEN